MWLKKPQKMGRKKSIHCGTCPSCNTESVHVKEYGSRHLKHFTIGEGGSKLFHYVALRCTNEACKVSCFRHYPPVEGIAEVSPRSRYTKSSKNFVGLKLSCQHVSFHGLKQAIVQDFDAHTSISSLHRWTQAIEVSDVSVPEEVKVLHTDEKHPSKKNKNVIKNS